LTGIDSFDIFDSAFFPIKLGIRGTKILRVLPGVSNWISDKARFGYDGIFKQRLNSPVVNYGFIENYYELASPKRLSFGLTWYNALNYSGYNFLGIKEKYRLSNLFIGLDGYVGSLADRKSLSSFKSFLNIFEARYYSFPDYVSSSGMVGSHPYLYTFKHSRFLELVLIDSGALVLYFIGMNLRWESPVLNLNLRSLIKKYSIPVVSLGLIINSNLPLVSLGNGFSPVLELSEGRH